MRELFTRYGHPVQIVFFAAFFAWWLLGAAWLLRRSIRKHTELKKQALAPCVLYLFLAGLGAAMVAGLSYRLVAQIALPSDAGITQQIEAAIPGAIAAIPMAFLVLYAGLQFPLGRLLRVCWLPAATVFLALGVFVGSAFLLGLTRKLIDNDAQKSVAHLREFDQAIRLYEGKHDKQEPKDLWVLTQKFRDANGKVPLLNKSSLECPFLPGVPLGYFYRPGPSLDPEKDKLSQILRACEWNHSHVARYRSMLLANGNAWSMTDGEFQSVLGRTENAEFAKAYRAAEANRR